MRLLLIEGTLRKKSFRYILPLIVSACKAIARVQEHEHVYFDARRFLLAGKGFIRVGRDKSWEARWEGRSLVVRTASTSYAALASEAERGSPDQITLSGSRGGRKRVSVEDGMWSL